MCVQMIFVLPPGCKTKEECAPIMIEAYNSVLANNMNAKWVTETDSSIANNDTRDVSHINYFIFQKFDGAFYQKVLNFWKVKILSPLCLLQCVTQIRPIPNSGAPLLSLALENCIVVCSSLPKERKKDVMFKVEAMAGLFSAQLVSNTKYLIANDVKSKKYHVATRSGINIMTIDFIDALWEASKIRAIHATDVEFQKYKCPVFLNLHVCSTGFAKNETQVQSLVTAHGGQFSSTLNVNKTDVLICKSATSTSSIKFKVAVKQSIDCVSADWILDSVAKGWALPKEHYDMKVAAVATSTPAEFEDDIVSVSQMSLSMIDVMSSQPVKNMVHQTEETCSVAPEIDVDADSSMKPLMESTLRMSHSAIFAGLKFAVGHFTQPEEDYIVELIKERQGTVVNAKTSPVNYSIVPISSSNAELNTPAGIVVTHLWVTDCTGQERLIVDLEYYHKPFAKMSDILSGLCISTSGLYRCEKEFLSYVITQLGGVSQDWMARNAIAEKNTLATTHLIANEPSGKKYDGALKWGLPIVHKNWLLRCAEENRRLAEDAFLIQTTNNTQIDDILNVSSDDRAKRRKLCQPSESFNNSINMNSESSMRKKWITDLPSQRKTSGTPLSDIKRQLSAKYYTDSCTSVVQEDDLPKQDGIPLQPVLDLTTDATNTSVTSVSLAIDNSDVSDNEIDKMLNAQIDELEAHMMISTTNNARRRTRKMQAGDSDAKAVNGRFSPVLSVVWDDNMVVPTRMNQNTAKRRNFMISNVDMNQRNTLVAQVESLSADVSSLNNFDPTATHLLCEQLNRNEKLLASMASGLWILHVSYVPDSAAAGKFLNEEDYEFGNPRAMSKFDLKGEFLRRASAAYYWREEVGRRGLRAFHDIKGLVFAKKREAMIRVLQAGGATIVDASPPFEATVDATYCFLELKNNDMKPYIPLAQQGILCVNTLYVNDFLHRTSEDFNDFIIPALRKYY